MAYTKPAKVLRCVLSGVSVAATYSGADPWNGNAIRWNATLTVTAQPHSDTASTPTSGFYTGSNVAVGDYFTTSGEGRVLRVYSISAQNSTTVTCVLEDYNRVNTFESPNQDGDGLIPSGTGYLFEVINGYPVLYPLPSALAGSIPTTFAAQIIGRFLSFQSAAGAPFIQTFNSTTDWGSAGGGFYTLTVTAATHGKSVPSMVRVQEDDGTYYNVTDADTIRINKTTGDVNVLVTDTPNGRFAGRIVIN